LKARIEQFFNDAKLNSKFGVVFENKQNNKIITTKESEVKFQALLVHAKQ